jgi:hypothetical protein
VTVVCSLKRLLTLNVIDTFLIVGSAVGSVLLFYYYIPSSKQFSINLSWTLLSFAFIFPLTMTIRCLLSPAICICLTACHSECYKRRESALQAEPPSMTSHLWHALTPLPLHFPPPPPSHA